MTFRRDILLAGAIGDAVGYIIEFMRLDKIKKIYGNEGLALDRIPDNAILYISDDTQMTLFALEATRQIKAFEGLPLMTDTETYQSAFNRWYKTQEGNTEGLYGMASFKSMQERRGPGNTCLGALRDQRPIFSKGCGGVMRAVPCGFNTTPEEAFKWGSIQAALTHSDPDAFLPSGWLAALISYLETQKEPADYHPFIKLEDAMAVANKFLRQQSRHDATLDLIYMAWAMAENSYGTPFLEKQSNIPILGEGWVGHEALAIALYAVRTSATFEECIQVAINHDGDSDSTGAIAAQIWAAAFGLPEKYKTWASRLDIADAFEYITEGIDD